MTPQELESNLSQFTGTENYHRYSLIFRNVVLTDGAKYLAENAGAFWLMDSIASYLSGYKDVFASAKMVRVLKPRPKGYGISINKAEMTESWHFTLDDGNGNVFCTQDIAYSDFPLDEITLFAAKQEALWVIMLPSEY